MKLNLLKVHGSNNTFYLYDALYDELADFVPLTKWLCNKKFDGGADGLLLVLPSKMADAKMRVINADGSEASMCGNGLRCVARYVCEKLGLEQATIETMHANLHVKKAQPIFEQLPTYEVEISPVSFELDTLPMFYEQKKQVRNEIMPIFSPQIPFTAVSVPNPHLIGVVPKQYVIDLSHQQQLASYLNGKNEICPDGVNVSYLHVISENEIFVRTFERGVGFTNACGTAMTASALISTIENLTNDGVITVYNPGGFVQCRIVNRQEMYDLSLIGNATVLGQYEIEMNENEPRLLDCIMSEEQLQYEKCNRFVKDKISAIF